jgi:hypothetical protein
MAYLLLNKSNTLRIVKVYTIFSETVFHEILGIREDMEG